MPTYWASAPAFREAVRKEAESFRLDPLTGQPNIELWLETAGMVEMLSDLAHEVGIGIYCSSGMNTIGAKYEAALRLIRNRERGNVVVFVGDLDPWGEARYANVRDDVFAFVRDLADVAPAVEFVTAALTREQVAKYGIPTEPVRPVRRAGKVISSLPAGWQVGDPSAQAEALRPDFLVTAIREAVMRHVDDRTLAETLAEEERQRVELLAEVMP